MSGDASQIEAAQETLICLATLLEKANGYAKKYCSNYDISNGLALGRHIIDDRSSTPYGRAVDATTMAAQRHRQMSSLNTKNWDVEDDSEFQAVMQHVEMKVGALADLLCMSSAPAATRQAGAGSRSQGRPTATHQRQSSAEAAMAQTGLYYYDIEVSESKVLNGNTVSVGWHGQVLDAPQTYKKLRINAQSKVMNGNMYGGGDFFST